jgi:prephenate dehydrogenase
MALRKNRLAREVWGLGRNRERLKKAKKLGAADKITTDWKKGLKGADLVFICTPVSITVKIFKRIVPFLKEGAVVTDVGSVKRSIVQEIEKVCPKNIHFVGGHPMAGSEKSGVGSARANLFSGATSILTPQKGTSLQALRLVKSIWKRIGARTLLLSPQEHDLSIAAVSHLPHLAALALIDVVSGLERKQKKIFSLSAGGFKDTTRIASSSPLLWRDIFLDNGKAILKMTRKFKITLEKIEELIASGQKNKLLRELKRAKGIRERIINGGNQG